MGNPCRLLFIIFISAEHWFTIIWLFEKAEMNILMYIECCDVITMLTFDRHAFNTRIKPIYQSSVWTDRYSLYPCQVALDVGNFFSFSLAIQSWLIHPKACVRSSKTHRDYPQNINWSIKWQSSSYINSMVIWRSTLGKSLWLMKLEIVNVCFCGQTPGQHCSGFELSPSSESNFKP